MASIAQRGRGGRRTIAIDARYVRERPSGIGSMVQALVRRVPALMPDMSFLLLRHPLARGQLSDAPNVREVTVHAEANGPGTLLVLPRLVNLADVDLFHATFNILPSSLPMPSVVTIHDLMWLTEPALCGAEGAWGQVQTAFYRNGIRRALRDATMIITISEATRDEIRRVAPDASERCRTVYHGVDPAFRPAQAELEVEVAEAVREQYAPGAKRHVLVVGRSAPYKNQQRAVAAFLRAFRDDPDTHLIVIQRLGSASRAFMRMAQRAGAERRVHVLAAVPFEHLLGLYQSALCLCHPSLVEGWGMPVDEALACGCPVVTSDPSAMPEVAGPAAVFVDPLDEHSIAAGLRAIAVDEGLRSWLRATGLRVSARRTWEMHAEATVRVYREALEVGSERARLVG